jgi:glucose/arabinose dehydrogenase
MLRRIALVAAVCTLCFAQKPAPQKPATPKPKAQKTESKSEIPKTAVEVAPGVYKYVDGSGKPWTYRKTPFGVVKVAGEPTTEPEAKASAPAASQPSPFGEVKQQQTTQPTITVTEDGDNLRFERPSPFGPYKWVKKKSELTAAERAAWERQRTSSGSDDKK